ncbi:hypothetical protein D3C80_1023090 [compost metagenome]
MCAVELVAVFDCANRNKVANFRVYNIAQTQLERNVRPHKIRAANRNTNPCGICTRLNCTRTGNFVVVRTVNHRHRRRLNSNCTSFGTPNVSVYAGSKNNRASFVKNYQFYPARRTARNVLVHNGKRLPASGRCNSGTHRMLFKIAVMLLHTVQINIHVIVRTADDCVIPVIRQFDFCFDYIILPARCAVCGVQGTTQLLAGVTDIYVVCVTATAH